MLPKIISNITLALIAIFVIYTFAPLLRDTFLSFFGAPKKKNYTKDEFEDLVRRKQERMGSKIVGKGMVAENTASKPTRSEFDYLYENNFFISEEEKNNFKELRKELEWGAGKKLTEIQKIISKKISQDIEVEPIVKKVKETMTKSYFLESFPQKGISLSTYTSNLAFTLLISGTVDLSLMAKKLQLSEDELKQIIITTIEKEQNQDWISGLEHYIETGSSDLSMINIVKTFEYEEFLAKLKKNIDIIAPLANLDDKKLRQLYNEEDKDLLKKKHKKLLTLYHPDKWTFADKSDGIDKRLRENFDKIQNEYALRTK